MYLQWLYNAVISYKATFFRGWKPFPREIDVKSMTLTHNFMKFHISAAAGQKNGQSDQERNLTKCKYIFLTGSTGWTGYGYTKTKQS
jgi:hypothetical protein